MSDEDSEYEEKLITVLLQYLELVKSFKDCMYIHDKAPEGSDPSIKALEKAFESAKILDERLTVYMHAPEGSDLKNKILNNILHPVDVEPSDKYYISVHKKAPKESELGAKALEEAVRHTSDPMVCIYVLNDILYHPLPEGSFYPEIQKKLENILTTPVNCLIYCENVPYLSPFAYMGYDKLFEIASSFDLCIYIHNNAPGGISPQTKALDKAFGFAKLEKSIDNCIYVVNNAPAGSDLEREALDTVRQLSESSNTRIKVSYCEEAEGRIKIYVE